MTWNFSDLPEMAPVAIHRHRPVVQDSTGCSMSKHPAGLAHSRIGEIGCLINAAMVVLGSVGERDDELDARAPLEQGLMAIEIILDTSWWCSLRAMRTISATLNLSTPP